MLGSEMIIGISEQALDNKNRIILPKFSNASKGDEVILFQEESYFSIYDIHYFIQKIDFLKKSELLDLKNFLVLKRKYDDIMSNVLTKCCVDGQRRILLPQLIVDYYQLNNSVVVRGAIDHINVFKSDRLFTKNLKKMD